MKSTVIEMPSGRRRTHVEQFMLLEDSILKKDFESASGILQGLFNISSESALKAAHFVALKFSSRKKLNQALQKLRVNISKKSTEQLLECLASTFDFDGSEVVFSLDSIRSSGD